MHPLISSLLADLEDQIQSRLEAERRIARAENRLKEALIKASLLSCLRVEIDAVRAALDRGDAE